mmetsp:Transcript_11886/g.21396  ORF Transcript_11886/g.21396 Transcript_11886/m.21396 type:complete len:80 (+) Transcript_11886:1039-1278(+)
MSSRKGSYTSVPCVRHSELCRSIEFFEFVTVYGDETLALPLLLKKRSSNLETVKQTKRRVGGNCDLEGTFQKKTGPPSS